MKESQKNKRRRVFYKILAFGNKSINGVFQVAYSTAGEWTEAPSSTKLFIFNSLTNAKQYFDEAKDGYSDLAIYECEVSEDVEPLVYRSMVGGVTWMRNFWVERAKNRDLVTSFTAPTGTMVAARVKLGRCVKRFDSSEDSDSI